MVVKLHAFAFGRGQARVIGGGQGLELEAALAGLEGDAFVVEGEADVGGVGQGAQDVLQLAGADGDGHVFGAEGGGGAVADLDFDVGDQQGQRVTLLLDEDVREDGQGVAFFDDAGHRLQRDEEGIAGRGEKQHVTQVSVSYVTGPGRGQRASVRQSWGRIQVSSATQHLGEHVQVVVELGIGRGAARRWFGRRAAPWCGRGRRRPRRWRGRLMGVRSLARNIATWRGRAITRVRFFECMSATLIL